MKRFILTLALVLLAMESHSDDSDKVLNLSCNDFSWTDVESLVEPYLDDTLKIALVMQGQSSEYKTSAAAYQAMNNDLPDVIKKILESLIEKNC